MVLFPIVAGSQLVILTLLGTAFYKPDLIPRLKRFPAASTEVQAENNCFTTCGVCTEITSVSGILRPPSYPDFYGGTNDCVYQISVTSGKTITMYLPFLILPPGDKLNVHDGSSTFDTAVTLFGETNGALTYKFTSTSNALTIQFSSLAAGGGGLWSINYVIL